MATIGIDPFVYKIVAALSVPVIGSLMLFVWKIAAPPAQNPDGAEEEAQRQQPRERANDQQRAGARENDNRQQNRGGGLRRIRNRLAAQEEQEQRAAQEENLDRRHHQGENGDAEGNGDREANPEEQPVRRQQIINPKDKYGVSISKKKQRKLQEKEERAKHREAMEARKKELAEQEDQKIFERKKRQLEEEESEAKEEQELKLARQERDRKAQEEYDAVKHQFTVEESGTMADCASALEKNTQQFIDDIKKTKVVYVEDLAAKYEVKPQVIVEKITLLESQGRLSGIIDERGKYIYLTERELTSVAVFVKQRGRVNVLDIQRESNKLINLTPQVSVSGGAGAEAAMTTTTAADLERVQQNI